MSDMSNHKKIAVFSMGERIRKAREDKGWHQEDLADGVKKSRATIAGWENNKHKPSRLEIDIIAELTGYDVEFFTITDSDGGSEKYLVTDHVLVAA